MLHNPEMTGDAAGARRAVLWSAGWEAVAGSSVAAVPGGAQPCHAVPASGLYVVSLVSGTMRRLLGAALLPCWASGNQH
jgi:hypothetical protein